MIYRKRQTKRTGIILKLILAVLAISAITGLYYYNQYQYFVYTAVNPQNTQETVITVKKGENTSQIAEKLFQNKLILNQDSFKLYTKFNNLDKDLKIGRFSLNQSLNVTEITKILSSDQNRQEIVTIPEGATTEEIDKILSNSKLINSGEFNQAVKNFHNYSKYSFLDEKKQQSLIYPLEGYLYPDTYFVSPNNFSADTMISLLLNTFNQKTSAILSASTRPISDIINVAAMVEEETNTNESRPIVAGIIWKRLDEKWALGIDATLLYLKSDRSLDYKDLKNDSEYNTRTRQGLPAGPIANPGLASIKAAANPANTDYYYYLTGKDGQMYYGKTNSEHASNKSKYL